MKRDERAVRRRFKSQCGGNRYRSAKTKRCRKIPAGGIPAAGDHVEYEGAFRRGGPDAAMLGDVDMGALEILDLLDEGQLDMDAFLNDPLWQNVPAADVAEALEYVMGDDMGDDMGDLGAHLAQA